MKKKTDLSLPPFAWLTDDALNGRNVILHVRSASVIEMLEDKDVHLNADTIAKKFIYRNMYGIDEHMIAALHYSPLVDDRETIINEIIDPAIKYYKDDCDKQDRLSEMEGRANLQ